MKSNVYLARNWPTSRVRRCLGKKDKDGLVRFLKERHEERFFKPLRHLKSARGNVQGYGFTVMAVCALLVETIQSYRDGLPTTHNPELIDLRNLRRIPPSYRIPVSLHVNGRVTFRRFFHAYRNKFDRLSGAQFYSNIRNGLLHQGQTKAGWTLSKEGPQVWDGKTIFRDNFAEALEECFNMYLAKLEKQNWNSRLWINTARKIWWLIRLS